ncbi:hypothetical protein ACELLULO517_20220 [Acidisoma cellulosilytica]|uniref:Uncharacterized protein n=1 Tax=Acidisoma cellulosilyticum TaxID=2802395 RepID=A0A963Z4G8_9PROT|nr:hypothetical protein [Acidisoma cellulosilyticum]MCB8882583.1 hypothetical protein [Acidisoma cellulosilyticum]
MDRDIVQVVLPEGLSEEQKARYAVIAAVARRTADRLPRGLDEAIEPAHSFTLHLR